MNLYNVLLAPIVTEKSVRLQENNEHSFKIHKDATKIDVINAVKTFYGIIPDSVRIIRVPSKVRLIGRSRLYTKRRAHKKAIVSLPTGKSLELVGVKKAEAASAKVKKVPKKKTSSEKKTKK